MRFIWFFTLLLSLAAVSYAGDDDGIIDGVIKGVMSAFLGNIRTIGLQKDPINIQLPAGGPVEGSIQLNGSSINLESGVTIKDLQVTNNFRGKSTNKTLNIQLAVYLKKFLVIVGYGLDIAIKDILPLYGQGELDLAAKAIRLNVSISLIEDKVHKKYILEDFILKDLSFKSDESKLIGFVNNPVADDVFTNIINIGEEAFALFYNIEKECITCILQDIIKFVVNSILKNKVHLDFDCDCLKKPHKLGYDLKSNLEGLVTTTMEGSMEESIKYILSDKMIPMWNDVYQRIIRLLDRKGLLAQFH